VVLSPLEDVVGSALIIAFFALVGEGASRVIRRFGKRAGIRETTLIGIRDISRVIWIVLAIVGVAVFTDLASDLTVLAVSTVGGLILSLSLQATLSNVIAGLFMLEDGTLRVGDEVTYGSVKGTVVRITLRTSWIMTEKGVLAVISNSNLLGGPLTVHTATTRLIPKYHLEGLVPRQMAEETTVEIVKEPALKSADEKSHVKRIRKGPESGPERSQS
jgi:small-conductance mechanosensitive channel